MNKDTKWKRELKEVLAISAVFFVIFVLFLLLKKVILKDYSVDFYVISTALIGSLIIAKVVLIFDLLPITKKTDHLPGIYRVFFRSLVYIVGFVIFSFLEHLIKGLIEGGNLSQALESSLHNLYSPAFIISFVGVLSAFLLFNAFWVIRSNIGPAAMYDMFFKRKTEL